MTNSDLKSGASSNIPWGSRTFALRAAAFFTSRAQNDTQLIRRTEKKPNNTRL